jgi:hypothetical protein
LGADIAFGGIGNDFLVGGGVSQARVNQALAAWIEAGNNANTFVAPTDTLQGGRNADFFFGELSLLDNTDGNRLNVNGGSTSDDSAAGNNTPQDSDWFLLEVSDDEDGTVVNLADEAFQTITTGAGRTINLAEIEHIDASGNLYGFVDGVDVALGGNGQVVDGENVGIGSTAQLNIIGSDANNILIGGYDNDRINGGNGSDLLFGGRLDYNNNPNIQTIVNDGRDELFGGAGADNLVWEADGGIYEGEAALNIESNSDDTLWLTDLQSNVADLTTDGTVRFDLKTGGGSNAAGGVDASAGYGGADENTTAAGEGTWTADQTNYVDGQARSTVQDVENVIATGLGGIDYQAAGTNDPELNFNNQQNLGGFEGNLDLRGTDGANVLYANTGDDVLEGREGNDNLSGGAGNDDFIFSLADGAAENGDKVDVIHRQIDADGDNLWDRDAEGNGLFGQDFGLDATSQTGSSSLILSVFETNNPGNELTNLTVTEITSVIRDADGDINFTLDTPEIRSANTYAELLVAVQDAIAANSEIADSLSATLEPNGTILITDSEGRVLEDQAPDAIFGVSTNNLDVTVGMNFGEPQVQVTEDRLIYQAYEDRADGEGVDDDSSNGSTIALGTDNYAEDLVINFAEDGTRIAEDQVYDLTFANLTTEDVVTIKVNGVEFSLQVGVDLDGNAIAAEDGIGDTQAGIQAAFLTRLTDFINSFMDDDTAAGQVGAVLNQNNSTISLTQTDYNGEETVFMTTPEVEIDNRSGGEQASVTIVNNSGHEVHLLDFDGRNGQLNSENVLFQGNSGISRAVLETATEDGGDLSGSDAILIDGGADDLKATVEGSGDTIFNNTATNATLAQNFSAHGDDLLIGGDGDDNIQAGTGDDRVHGSLGEDTIDGGKNYYQVQVLGESQARVYELNVWEAANFTLAGEVISSINLIDQAESGNGTVGGLFDDTLLFQQGDFETGNTEFTITLNDYNLNGGVVELQNDGAGTVDVDVDGDGLFESTTTFTNFENIRTVSGTGNAVADDGQGNDTLNVASLSTDTGGISYDLTNGGNAGEVKYSTDIIIDADGPDDIAGNADDEKRGDAADYETDIIRVDGVENVIAGQGDDLLVIDETEAAKHNSFEAGLGTDRIDYQNNYAGAPTSAEPTVTIKVNTANDTDTVTMTGGRVGSTQAVDTLESVEYISLNGDTAESSREDDVLDVTSMVTGAVVDYTNGEVRDLNGNVQVTVEGIAEIENVWADGDDTVIVADATNMGGANAREDATDGTAAEDLTFATFMDFDELNASNGRVAFNNQSAAQITDVVNQFQYTFDLSKTGTGNDTDTVDYSNAVDSIAVVVELDENQANQYVLVDGDNAAGDTFDAAELADVNENRVDVLTDVERIVASQAESVLDLTSSTKGLEIKFGEFDINNRDAALDRDVYNVQVSDLASSVPLTRSYVEYRDAGTNASVTQNAASWNRIEGSDQNEVVIMSSAHSTDDDTFNLRGGDNQVKYNELTRSIETQLNVSDFDANNALTTGLITATTTFQDGSGGALPGGGTHVATSYTADNGIAAGSLKLAASQDAEDTLSFAGNTSKLFVLGEQGTTDNQITVKIGQQTANNSVILTGYEFLQDADSDDVYDMGSLTNVLGNLTLTDNANPDRDTIKVNDDAVGFAGAAANEINMEELNDDFNFDFDVLDITNVTDNGLTITGDTDAGGVGRDLSNDELILGNVDLVDAVTNFDTLSLTDASVTSAGSTFDLDMTAGELQDAGDGTLFTFDGDTEALDASRVTSDLTLTVTGAGAVSVIGGQGDDTITGGDGNNTLRGGAGDDTLDGGVTAEVLETLTFDFNGGVVSSQADNTAYIEVADGTGAIRFFNDGTVEGDVDGFGAGAASVVLVGYTGFTAGSGADAVGDAIAELSTADLQTYLTSFDIQSVSYDGAGAGGQLTVTYASLEDPAPANLTLEHVEGVAANSTLEANATTLVGAAVQSAQGDQYAAQVNTADTYVFEATAAENGVDTINNFDGTDTLDVSAFLGGIGGFNVGPFTTASNGNANVDNDVSIFNNGGTALTAATLAAEFAGGGTAFSAAADDVAVIFEIDPDGNDEDANVWFVNDANGDGSIAESEVSLVGVVADADEIAFGGVNFVV